MQVLVKEGGDSNGNEIRNKLPRMAREKGLGEISRHPRVTVDHKTLGEHVGVTARAANDSRRFAR